MTVRNSKFEKQVREDYENALFRLVMHNVAEQEGRKFLEENRAMGPPETPSEATLSNFEALLSTRLRRQQLLIRRLSRLATVRKMAAAMFIGIVVFVTAMTTVQAFRVRVMNLWLDIRPEYTTFKLKEKNTGSPYDDDFTVNWINAYVPTVIPEGYTVSSMSIGALHREIIYESNASLITYSELNESVSPTLDTENADHIETVNINGNSGILIVKNEWTTVIWAIDESIFRLRTQTDIETAIKVARGVKYVK